MKEIPNITQEKQNVQFFTQLLDSFTLSEIIQMGFFKTLAEYPTKNFKRTCEHCGSVYKSEEGEKEYYEAVKKYHEEENKVYRLFKTCLFKYHGIESNEKTEKAYSIAWDQGHHAGFNEVAIKLDDIVELVK
jgi:hypothetical protein